MNREIGAAITVQANAMRVLEYFGYDSRKLKGVDFTGVSLLWTKCIPQLISRISKTVRFKASGGGGISRLWEFSQNAMGRVGGLYFFPKKRTPMMKQAGWLCHRTDLHDELKRLAIGIDGHGSPAHLHLGCEVSSCEPNQGILMLKNGDVHQADLIIGADGIHVCVSS